MEGKWVPIFNMKANYKRALRQECLLKKDHLSFWKTWNAKFSCKEMCQYVLMASVITMT